MDNHTMHASLRDIEYAINELRTELDKDEGSGEIADAIHNGNSSEIAHILMNTALFHDSANELFEELYYWRSKR